MNPFLNQISVINKKISALARDMQVMSEHCLVDFERTDEVDHRQLGAEAELLVEFSDSSSSVWLESTHRLWRHNGTLYYTRTDRDRTPMSCRQSDEFVYRQKIAD